MFSDSKQTAGGVARASALVLALLLGALLAPSGLQADTSHGSTGLKPDLRLLVDISGSMKISDPDNLRRPALELLVRLLPEGAKAGVWIFGEDVQVLVPHGIVDAQWRQQARQAMSRIDNSGQRTNIPDALAAATYDLQRMDPGFRTSIVLLTDGKVDVAESPMVNASAARTLLAAAAPELGATGIPVHTIALSAEADWVFLRALAQHTGGIAEQAENASNLSAIFLQSLEMVAPTARVPLSDSGFAIDDSVAEFTVLVFFEGGKRRVGLVSPSGVQYQAKDTAENVDWYLNKQFALVTVTSPEPGNWRLDAPGSATVKITVISDLQLEIDPLPNSLAAGRQAELGLRLTEQGRALIDPEVLAAFSLTLDITKPDGSTRHIDISENYPAPADGEYRVLVPVFDVPGRYELMVRLDAQTMQRELPLYVEVAVPPNQATLVTRGQAPPEDELRVPLIVLAGVLAVTLLLVWLILRRRKQRKMEIWQRRSRQLDGQPNGQSPLSGVSAAGEDHDRQLD